MQVVLSEGRSMTVTFTEEEHRQLAKSAEDKQLTITELVSDALKAGLKSAGDINFA